jgi:pimeloyl-ACP methyl ester carboxylesterase
MKFASRSSMGSHRIVGLGSVASVFALVAACSSSGGGNAGVPSSSGASGNVSSSSSGGVPVLLTASQACGDTVESVYGDPGAVTKGADNRGRIIKCAKEASISKADLQAKLVSEGYVGTAATTGVSVYRILYQTERGDEMASPGYASAKVLIPDVTAGPQIPAVVVASGTRGQAALCAPSKSSAEAIPKDATREMLYAAAAAGMPTIVTDLAGYANFGAAGNFQSAYALSADAGRSTLDAARALRKLFPAISEKVELVGHSLGGHTVLSALALRETYAAEMKIAAVAVHSPFWIPQSSWGAILNETVAKSFKLSVAEVPLTAAIAVWYHYGHAELLDGPGKGLELFVPEKRAIVKSFVENYCLGFPSGPESFGVDYIHKIFDPSFVTSVQSAAPGLLACNAGDKVCDKWLARYRADRPTMAGEAAKTPILVTYGEKDTTIPPSRARCGTDKLQKDGANFKVCFRKGQDHSSIVGATSSDVSKWLLAKATGSADPDLTCDNDVSALTEECPAQPPND